MSMKAAVYARYGPPVLVQIMDVKKLTLKHSEILIKVRVPSVNPAGWR